MLLQIANAKIDVLTITSELTTNNELTLSVWIDTTHDEQIEKLKNLGEALVLAGDRTEPFSQKDIDSASWQRFFVVNINPKTILSNEYIVKIGELA